jgi:hypothetical protein
MAINATYAAFTKKVVAFGIFMSKIMVPFFGKGRFRPRTNGASHWE